MRLHALLALPMLAGCATLERPAEPSYIEEAAAELDTRSAPEALRGAAHGFDVPADLLAAIAWVETGFAAPTDHAGWMGFDAPQQLAIAELLQIEPAALRDRSTNLLAGAAWLDHLRDQHAPAADGALEDWLPAVEAWSGDPLHAAEVYAVLQSGLVAWTDETTAEDLPLDSAQAEAVITLAPRSLSLPDHVVDLPWTAAPGYPGAVGALLRPAANTTAPTSIVVRASGDSFAGSLSGDGHYVVNRRDGAVVQLRDELGDSLVVVLAAPDTSFAAWSAPLLEGAALLVEDLAVRHGLQPHAVDTSALGQTFPRRAFEEMVSCTALGGTECGGAVGLPVDVPVVDTLPAGDDERDSALPDVAYFYQYANSLHPSASCQNTSIAMVLKTLGWNGTPDDITARFGKDRAQSPGGLAAVFNEIAADAGLSARLIPHTSGSVEGLRALLNAGKPTIIHGYMTGYGHVFVATKYTGSHYVVNDPAGRWAERWKGGYPYGWNANIGRGILYGRAAFEQAVATSNGSSYLPLWYHELTGVDASDIGTTEPEPAPPAEDPIGDDPTSGTTSPDGDTRPGGAYSASDGVTVQLLEPRHGTTVGDPMRVLARRSGGAAIEVVSDGWDLIPRTAETEVSRNIDIWTHGERTVTARALSEYGTVLATHTVRVIVQETAELSTWGSSLGGLDMEFGALTSAPGATYVQYSVDGWPLTDSYTDEDRAYGTNFPLRYTFNTPGEGRVLRARAYDADGNLVAEGETLIDVIDGGDLHDIPEPDAGCALMGTISCGDVVSGDTSTAAASDVIDAYTDSVGLWDAPELAWSFSGSGTVTVGFVDPQPSVLNLDIMILETNSGTCRGEDLMAIAWNSLEFEANGNYVFVVDGYDGAMGAFELYVECD